MAHGALPCWLSSEMLSSTLRASATFVTVACVLLASAPIGSASNGEVANVARASSLTYREDNAAITRALKRLDLSSLSSVNALVDTGASMERDMRIHKQLLANTAASTKTVRTGRSLLLRGLTALAATGGYMMRYGRALGSSAPLSVLQVDIDGYRINAQEGETFARRGAALLGIPFG